MALGALADRVRSHIPQSYQALISASYYGETLIQQHIDDMQFKLFSTVVGFSLEATMYDRYELGYMGKVCTLDIIPSAIDYWMDQLQSETATGTDEQITFPDRISALEKTYARLAAEVAEEKATFEDYTDTTIRAISNYPKVSTSADDMVTTDPAEFPKEFSDELDVIQPWGTVQ